ncbi:uncharacterized protein A4U43_C01F18580 [Asparagus officinalis]|uniref:Uncharacterized protein n=1 Tax=Asparagus officinalis TaxID=4686 RepID=A0A5P1FQL6_ASPOF|nr:uncharacterized protein A4U43_C01F18580 [Asparagus officinalis]
MVLTLNSVSDYRLTVVQNLYMFMFLEVIRLEGHGLNQYDILMSRDMFLLQLCSGVDDNSVGACAQLLFAPIDESFADDAPLLS